MPTKSRLKHRPLSASWLLPAAAEAAPAAEVRRLPELSANKGDTAWMLTSTVLVILMSIPGLALFYGGLVRSKNMLSVLMQVFYRVLVDQRAVGHLRLQRWPSAAKVTSSPA